MVDNLESRENSFRKGYSVFLGSDVEVLDGDDDVGGVFLLGFVSILVRAFKKSAEGPAVWKEDRVSFWGRCRGTGNVPAGGAQSPALP